MGLADVLGVGGKGSKTAAAPAEDPGAGELEAVAADLIAAVKADDAAGVASALRAAVTIASDEGDED